MGIERVIPWDLQWVLPQAIEFYWNCICRIQFVHSDYVLCSTLVTLEAAYHGVCIFYRQWCLLTRKLNRLWQRRHSGACLSISHTLCDRGKRAPFKVLGLTLLTLRPLGEYGVLFVLGTDIVLLLLLDAVVAAAAAAGLDPLLTTSVGAIDWLSDDACCGSACSRTIAGISERAPSCTLSVCCCSPSDGVVGVSVCACSVVSVLKLSMRVTRWPAS